jgi:hypothetical protein
MLDTSYEILTMFFRDHLPFTPTAGQIDQFQSDLRVVSPNLMYAALLEVKKGTLGNVLVYQPNDWRPAIFSVYNRKVAEHFQLFPIFHSFETAIRSTVAVELEKHYGHRRWWEGISKALRAGKPAKSIKQVGSVPISARAAFQIERMIYAIDGELLQNAIVPNLKNGYEFLEHSDLGHLGPLITEHWSVFAPLFSVPKPPLTIADFRAKFNRVKDARNDVYHHKSVARVANVVSTAEELLDRLNFSLKFVYEKVCASQPVQPAFKIAIEQRHNTWQS